jgi:hypothetical protein
MALIALAVLGIVGLMLLSWLRASREARREESKRLSSELKGPKP